MEALGDGPVGVVAQAPGIGHRDQEEIKGRSRVAALIQVLVTDQAMIQPTESLGGFSDTLGTDEVFLYHGGLLCDEG